MSKPIEGTFTLNDVVNLTDQSKFKSRFEYADRDVLKTIVQIKETTLHPDSNMAPTVTYIWKTKSYPQYSPYNKFTKYSKQRKFSHQYDSILSMAADDNGTFSLNSKNWKYRLGSQKKWIDKPPQSKVKTIYRETSEKWRKDKFQERETLIKHYSCETLKKKIKQLDEKYKKKIVDHRKSAKYLCVGDFCAQELGINGDFYFRCQNCYQKNGHLYGRNTAPDVDNDDTIFVPKHFIRLITSLMKLNILHE